MKIVKLTANNYKRLQAVEITPDGNVVMITGKNAQGKSSILDAIMSVLCGKRYDPVKPIREGEDHADVVIETENWIIKRTWTKAGGGSLTVKNAEGFAAGSPQKLLDKIVGKIAFDPLNFVNDSETNQKKTLMELVDLKVDDLDQKIADQKQIRSDVKRDKESNQHELDKLGEIDMELPTEAISISDVTRKLTAAMAANSDLIRQQGEIETIIKSIVNCNEQIQGFSDEIAGLEKQIETIKGFISAEETKRTEVTKGLDETKKSIKDCTIIDTAEIQTEIDSVEQKNKDIDLNNKKIALVEKVAACRVKFAEAGTKVAEIEAEKTKRIIKVKMPIEGLGINETSVTYEGIPMSQINEASKLKVGVAISMALNPELKVIRLKGNDLDSDSLKTVADMVKEKDFQIWIEKVDETGEIGFVIEDGMVANRTE